MKWTKQPRTPPSHVGPCWFLMVSDVNEQRFHSFTSCFMTCRCSWDVFAMDFCALAQAVITALKEMTLASTGGTIESIGW